MISPVILNYVHLNVKIAHVKIAHHWRHYPLSVIHAQPMRMTSYGTRVTWRHVVYAWCSLLGIMIHNKNNQIGAPFFNCEFTYTHSEMYFQTLVIWYLDHSNCYLDSKIMTHLCAFHPICSWYQLWNIFSNDFHMCREQWVFVQVWRLLAHAGPNKMAAIFASDTLKCISLKNILYFSNLLFAHKGSIDNTS